MEPKAFNDWSVQNLTAVNPRVFLQEDNPVVAFKQFRFKGFKSYGWDTYLMRYESDKWTIPTRISEITGPPDAEYSILSRRKHGKDIICFLPVCDHLPRLSFFEESIGSAGRSFAQPASDHRIEILRFKRNESFPPVIIPAEKQAPYILHEAAHDPRPEPPVDPPPLKLPDKEFTLVWGDLHAHSAYSKCMSANDGTPRDVLQFQRDVLGCRVLCLTEHVEYMTYPEFTHVFDCVERETGDDCIPLYAVEWAKKPAHHTNFYAIDRDVFEQLISLMLVCDHLNTLFERIKNELPEGSVAAIRHMHGMNESEYGVCGKKAVDTYDPKLEWAMEAMQTRGNMMVESHDSWPQFPNNFLNSGARIGIIWGSDHSRGCGPNRFCLTGFWVKEVSASAIFRAIQNRKTIAVSNVKIALYVTLNAHTMGEVINVSAPVSITCRLSSARQIRKVCLMRDGHFLEWMDVNSNETVIELVDENASPGEHWYVVTADACGSESETEPGQGFFRNLAHSSPFFVTVSV